MSRFEDDLARGCLSTGEPLEALYGTCPWTVEPEPEPPYEELREWMRRPDVQAAVERYEPEEEEPQPEQGRLWEE